MKPDRKTKLSGIICAFAVVAATLLLPGAGRAQAVLNIAASVNEDIITEYDIVQRIRYMIASGTIPNDPKVIRSVRTRILNALIDEKLQLLEGSSQGMSVSPDQESQMLQAFAQRFGMNEQQLVERNARAGIDREHLADMLASAEIWRAVVRQRFGGRVTISDSDIANQRIEVENSRKEPERRLFELALPLSIGEEQARQKAAALYEQLKSGADFSTLALEHSQAPSAQRGGELGWMQAGRLSKSLSSKLAGSGKGDLVGPFKYNNSYMILWVADTRARQEKASGSTMVSAYRLSFENVVRDGNDPQDVANNYRAAATDCSRMEQLVTRSGAPSEDMGTGRLRDYPAAFQQALATLPLGQASQPIVHDGGRLLSVVMACSRRGGGAGQVSDEELRQLLLSTRLQAHGERYMEELRRNAFIDIRQE